MKALIRGFTAILAFAMVANAQQTKDTSSYLNVVSGTPYAFYNSQGSGTLTFTFSFAGTPSGVSITVQGCGFDGVTCTTLTPITGANPYVTSSSGQVTYAGGYNQYKVTPTFTGTTLNLYLTGIQAKLSTGGGGSGTVSSGTTNAAARYTANGTTVGPSAIVTDDGTTWTDTGQFAINAPSSADFNPTVNNASGNSTWQITSGGGNANVFVRNSTNQGWNFGEISSSHWSIRDAFSGAIPFDIANGSPNNAFAIGTASITATIPISSTQFKGTGTAPTCTVAAGAGTGATCSVTGTNTSGQLTLVTGTTTASGLQVTINWNGTLASAPNNCPINPRTSATAALGNDLYDAAPTTTSFQIGSGATAFTASTTFVFGYGPCV